MIKLTINCTVGCFSDLVKFSKENKLPFKSSFLLSDLMVKISKNHEEWDSKIHTFNKLKDERYIEICDKDEKGQPIIIGNRYQLKDTKKEDELVKEIEEFSVVLRKELDEIGKKEMTYDSPKIKIKDLEGLTGFMIEPASLHKITWLFEE